jgi:hypothetical protein
MSDLYEAVITIADLETAHSAFRSLSSSLYLRLIRLAERLYAVHRIATRNAPFDEAAINDAAAQISNSCGQSLAVFYDNRCDINCCNLFRKGTHVGSFGKRDELWVLLDNSGQPIIDGDQFTVDQLEDDEEYGCIQSGIDAGLTSLGVQDPPSLSTLIAAFCYDNFGVEAERPTT